MARHIYLKTEHFELSIWCSRIEKSQRIHEQVVKRRGGALQSAPICFEPALSLIADPELSGIPYPLSSASFCEILKLPKPIFFDNKQYHFEWIFTSGQPVDFAEITHKLKAVNESFLFSPEKGRGPARITGSINTGNNIGWLRLPLKYCIDGQAYELSIAFEVLPTKMDLHSDVEAMYQMIDRDFPLWRFSLAEKTEHDMATSHHQGYFPLLWLANFASLRREFEQGLQRIAKMPHRQLRSSKNFLKADQYKGKVPERVAEKVREDLQHHYTGRRHRVEQKYLSFDTPENRFIKQVVYECKTRLELFHKELVKMNRSPDKGRLSQAFLDEVYRWQEPLKKMQAQRFMREVGHFRGLKRGSLVLQQQLGYSAVYRVWQELKLYLDVLAHQACVSVKSIDQIYETWCFLVVRKLLIDELGFDEVERENQVIKRSDLFSFHSEYGEMARGFKFQRADGLAAELKHEAEFKSDGAIRSYLVNQRPDILLRVTFPSGKQCIWLFDAKYRLENTSEKDGDRVPNDAINQMHRYRDALIHINHNSGDELKTRPVLGAFALFPGSVDQTSSTNDYEQSIQEIGIGAFPLLPDANRQGCLWLKNFLEQQLGQHQPAHRLQDQLFVQEAARIPYHGMTQVLYPDLVMTVALGGMRGRTSLYLDAFKQGKAEYYHIKAATFDNKYKKSVVHEIRFLALGETSSQNSHTKEIQRVWPVKGVVLKPRRDISEEQAGKQVDSDELYYLFQLGKPLILPEPVFRMPHRPFIKSMCLTTLSGLTSQSVFGKLDRVYDEALVR
ncbi:hypothetical protein VA7868_04532 [Vibrio aerogenes CECT 7868]|uniref:DUF2357 domain-containing protein n=1 Tax=Vibrio aerogenes CECT 7868 TaxID=1216006 RepID=A0A1M6EW71_9VIBR|nr:DUF2357 domain-containing protein [Vibrio aerogenes]SHI89686.1 hypothetical protein VA7868_04532 [Vibrio aerogenes CECT 7868]